jgi:hypothetical protein
MSPGLYFGWGMIALFVVIVAVAAIVRHEERQHRRLDRYRPTHENRSPHRDEIRMVSRAMRDWK